MTDVPKFRVSQMELICAILIELDRQNTGALVDQDLMNAIIRAANVIVSAVKDSGVAVSQQVQT